jgi:hypothetical protein
MIEVQVAIAAAVRSLAALARQPQALAIHRTRRDARFHGMRHARALAGSVALGQREIQLERRALKASSMLISTGTSKSCPESSIGPPRNRRPARRRNARTDPRSRRRRTRICSAAADAPATSRAAG